MIRAITPITAPLLLTLALVAGCDDSADKKAQAEKDAKEKIAAAGQDAKEEIQDAKKELNEAKQDYAEKVGEAHKELNEEAADAAKDVAEANADANKAAAGDRYERFEIIQNEDATAFGARADAAIARLETDLQDATTRSQKAATNDDLKESVADASTALTEARKDLSELRGKTGKVFDDGRVGVGLAINKAQRELSEAYQELAEARI